MPELIFATHNDHKLSEVQQMLGDSVIIRSLKDVGFREDIEETGVTFEENAAIKARTISQRLGLPCFADDSGLEVDALGGAPGVYSARYSGSRDTETNLQLVLSRLGEADDRRARFRTVICLCSGGNEHFFEGAVEGQITRERSGSAGFGYDPIFRPEGYDLTFADMTAAQKNSISHRAEAIAKLKAFLLL